MWNKIKVAFGVIGWLIAAILGGILAIKHQSDSKAVYPKPVDRDRERVQELTEATGRVEGGISDVKTTSGEITDRIELAEESADRLGDLLGIETTRD